MYSTTPFNNESTCCEPNLPPLNVPAMIRPILHNYDTHVNNFIRFLRDRLHIKLIYQGPDNIQEHIFRKAMYACSIYIKPKRILKDIFPIMIGSQLDIAIRHKGLRTFEEPLETSLVTFPFQDIDIGMGFFIINGFLRHVPYFYTNDPTNTHIADKKEKKVVRVYSYTALDKGKELSYYAKAKDERKSGDVVIVHNNGSETSEDPEFFPHCPYPVHLTAYMKYIHREDLFDIDHLGNKVVVSPGHLFTRLFIKYLYKPLREMDWKTVKSKASLVYHSIETGNLLHVLSRKTIYFKETKSAGKMTHEPQESYREIGANGEVFVEKNVGCYREVPSHTYPLNPYLLQIAVRQMSKKVNYSTIDAFHSSYRGFFCFLGCYETKNAGRTLMMVRDTAVSTCDDLDRVYHSHYNEVFWNELKLEPQADSSYFVVVNEACIPVTQASFHRVDLFRLKHLFGQIECFERGRFIVIRYKIGIIMKMLPGTNVWVSPYDELYWARRLFGIKNESEILDRWGYLYTTSYIVDLNQYFMHTAFLKNILAFNSLKNAVLATTSRYALYFMDTVTAYRNHPSKDHKLVLNPVEDGISKHFALYLPQVMVTYMSFHGLTQEDCIVKREDFRSFDFFRFYTLRFKLKANSWVRFYSVQGDEESNFLGTLVSGDALEVNPLSIHVRMTKVSSCEYHIYFAKTPFRLIQYILKEDMLLVSVENEHICSTGDKLCSLHGQKGVIRVVKDVPTLDGIQPDLILNPYCMWRMTPGQFKEALFLGGGKDATVIMNSEGMCIVGVKAFCGKTFYVVIIYLSNEHLYAPETCNVDRVLGQPVRGRSREGGMKAGNMEHFGMRGNGTGSSYEQKIHEHSDRMLDKENPTVATNKSIEIVSNDASFYKSKITTQSVPSISLVE